MAPHYLSPVRGPHLHWYIGNVLHVLWPTMQGVQLEVTAEIKVLYQSKQEVLDDMGRKQSKFLPAVDKVVKGSSGIMLDFHTSGILMEQAKEIQDSRDQASKVRARAQFKAADADGGGSLDREEMHQLLLDLGERAREKDVSAAFSKYAGGASDMDVEQFERWWMSRRPRSPAHAAAGRRAPAAAGGGPGRLSARRLGERRLLSAQAECSIDADDGLEDGIADQWFEEREDTYRDYMDRIAFMAGVGGFDEEAAAQDAEADHATHRQARMKNRLNPGDPGFTNERVLDRLGESSLLVSFTVPGTTRARAKTAIAGRTWSRRCWKKKRRKAASGGAARGGARARDGASKTTSPRTPSAASRCARASSRR